MYKNLIVKPVFIIKKYSTRQWLLDHTFLTQLAIKL